MSKPQFVYATYIQTTPEKLWEALTNGEFTRQYWGGYRIESDWKPGSSIKFYGPEGDLRHSDRVIKAEKPKYLSYTWKPLQEGMPDEPASTVSFEIENMGAYVKLTVSHFDFPENSKMFPMISGGWPLVLSSLKSYLENNKPMNWKKCTGGNER